MPSSTMNWESAETWERVLASVIATGVTLDLKAMAKYYGTTYDTLQNRMRKTKKIAEEMKANVKDGDGGKATPSKTVPKTPRKAKTPKKDPLETVASGRVGKKTPTKKTQVKTEDSDDEDVFGSVFNKTRDSSDLNAPHVDDDMFT